MSRTTLENRALVPVHGPDAATLLQDVITCDLVSLPNGVARQGALLTPQGKIMFDFLVSRYGEDGFLFELDRDVAENFAKRMTMYKLRAKMTIEPVDSRPVVAGWEEDLPETGLKDERFGVASGVYRLYSGEGDETASQADYDRLRVQNGVPEGNRDYELGDAFPHDAMMDLNKGVSFSKGCFVGQEVVSRMQHRGTARRRIIIVEADSALPATGSPITADGKTVGSLGTVAGDRALAVVRTDRAANALEKGVSLLAEDVPVRLSFAEWTGLSLSGNGQETGTAAP